MEHEDDDRECPWDAGEPIGIGPNDPCPVCGMLGTVEACEGEDLCLTNVRRRALELSNGSREGAT
jgi:hypothetical protein